MISIAASAARYALGQRHHVQIALCGVSFERIGPVEGVGELDSVLRALALARCDGEASFGSHLSRLVGITPQSSTLVAVYVDRNAGNLGGIDALARKSVLTVPGRGRKLRPTKTPAASMRPGAVQVGQASRVVRISRAFRQ